MSKIKIIGYPNGNIIKVTNKEFNKLQEEDLVRFDDEWTEDTPHGQWGFDNSDEDAILNFLKSIPVSKVVVSVKFVITMDELQSTSSYAAGCDLIEPITSYLVDELEINEEYLDDIKYKTIKK